MQRKLHQTTQPSHGQQLTKHSTKRANSQNSLTHFATRKIQSHFCKIYSETKQRQRCCVLNLHYPFERENSYLFADSFTFSSGTKKADLPFFLTQCRFLTKAFPPFSSSLLIARPQRSTPVNIVTLQQTLYGTLLDTAHFVTRFVAYFNQKRGKRMGNAADKANGKPLFVGLNVAPNEI